MAPLNFFLLLSFAVFAVTSVQSQDRVTLEGTVVDLKTRELLVGASVRISGTTLGTQSDNSGQFRLSIPNGSLSDSLIVTYVGYETYGDAISRLNRENLLITLSRQTTTLMEVVVHTDFWRKQYTPAELREDYSKFCTIMEKVHTGLFDYLSEKEWQAMKDSSLQLFTHPMSHREFYHLIAMHVGKVRNSHTKHGVTDWWYRQRQNIFPFNVRYFGDRLYVSESLVAELKFPRGCEILRINGRTPREIKEIIWPFIPADGYIQTGKLASLSAFFPWYFSLFVEESVQYEIQLRELNGNVLTITTSGLRDSFRHLNFRQVLKWQKTSLELTIDQELKAAYFRIEDSRVFKDSIQGYFQRIRENGVESLIIDLRGGGGIREEEQTADLYSYLIAKPSKIFESIQVQSNNYSLFDRDFTYKPYGKSLRHIKDAYFDKLVDSGNGYFLWQEESYLGLIEPSRMRFTGAVYILADGENYSASTDFTSLASQLENVFVIGEETGGEYRSYISGAMFGLLLPNSRIGVKVPTWKTILAIEEDPANRGRGVQPDYPVSGSLDDFLEGRDAVKEFAFRLISSRRDQGGAQDGMR